MEFNRQAIIDTYLEDDAWLAVPNFLFSQGRQALPNILFIPHLDEKAYGRGQEIDCSTLSNEEFLQLNGLYVERDNKRRGTIAINEFRKVIQFQEKGKNFFGWSNIEDQNELGIVYLLRRKRSKKVYEKAFNLHDLFGECNPNIKSFKRTGNKVILEVLGVYNAWSWKLNKAQVLKLINAQNIETFGFEKAVHTEFPLSRLLHFLFFRDKLMNPKEVLTNYADGIIKSFEIEVPNTYFPVFDEMSKTEVIEFFEANKWPAIHLHVEVYDEAYLEQFDDFIPLVGPVEIRYIRDEDKVISEPLWWKDYERKV